MSSIPFNSNLETYRTIFDSLDTDCSGVITADELTDYFNCLGWSVKYTAVKYESTLDIHQGRAKTFTFDEFVELMDSSEDSEWVTNETFKIFDRRQEGRISSQDLYDVLNRFGENVTETEIEEMLKDAGFDGLIGFSDLEKLLDGRDFKRQPSVLTVATMLNDSDRDSSSGEVLPFTPPMERRSAVSLASPEPRN